jgi:hypothetical protein
MATPVQKIRRCQKGALNRLEVSFPELNEKVEQGALTMESNYGLIKNGKPPLTPPPRPDKPKARVRTGAR